MLFLSGCSGKKSESRRTKAATAKPGAASPGPVVEIKNEKDESAEGSEARPTKNSNSGTGSDTAAQDADSVVLPPPGEPAPDVTQNTPAAAAPAPANVPPAQPQVAAPIGTPTTVAVKPTVAPKAQNKTAASATGANVLEKAGAKTEVKPEGKKSAADDLLVLSFEETKNLMLTMQSQMSDSSLQAITNPVVPENLDGNDLDIRMDGTFDKPVYSILNKKEKLVEFKDFAFSPAKQTKAKTGDYNLLGICTGAKCEVMFVAVYKIENGKLTENYPAILKWSGERYVPAQNMDPVKFAEELQKQPKSSDAGEETKELTQAEKIAKAPPQLRVKYLLENSFNAHFDSLIKRLDARMKKDNAIYSARFFYNIKSGSFDWILKRIAKDETSLNLKIEFVPTENKEAIEFKGTIPAKGVRLTDKGGITLDIYPVVSNEFFLMVFESQKFQSFLPDSKKGIQAYGCQVMVEENETYSECEPLASTYVLGISALEGRIGGPVFHNTDKEGKPVITQKYNPENAEAMRKQPAGKEQ